MDLLTAPSCVQRDLARTVQSALFVSAINTLVQTYFGARLPVVMGNSFYFLPMVLSIVNRDGIINIPDPHEVLPYSVVFNPLSAVYETIHNFLLLADALEPLNQHRVCTVSEVFEGDASHARGLHRGISFEYNSWFQRSLGHYHEVLC